MDASPERLAAINQPDTMAAEPASYGLTEKMGRMHCDAQFADSFSVPAHVEMMGFITMGNNPMVGASRSLLLWSRLRADPEFFNLSLFHA